MPLIIAKSLICAKSTYYKNLQNRRVREIKPEQKGYSNTLTFNFAHVTYQIKGRQPMSQFPVVSCCLSTALNTLSTTNSVGQCDCGQGVDNNFRASPFNVINRLKLNPDNHSFAKQSNSNGKESCQVKAEGFQNGT